MPLNKRSKIKNVFMSYSRYKIQLGRKMTKSTKYYLRKKAIQKRQTRIPGNVNINWEEAHLLPEPVCFIFDLKYDNMNFSINDEHQEQQQELENQILEILEKFWIYLFYIFN